MPSLRDVELRHLAALVAVAEQGSFAKAALSLGYTQSAVSQQIAALEKAVAMPVFDRRRGPKPAQLTPAGAVLLAHARAMLEHTSELADELDRLRRGVSGLLVVGTFQSVSAELLPEVVGRMRRQAPEVDVRLFENDDQAALLRGVLDDQLDLTFTVDAQPAPELHVEVVGRDPFVVIAAAGDLQGPVARPEDLDDRPVIGQPTSSVCQVLIEQRLAEAGIRPRFVFRSQDNGAVQGMVRSGLGRAVVPRLAVDLDDPGIVVLPLDPPIEPRTIQLTRRADRTLPPAADHFTRIVHEVAAEVLPASEAVLA